MKLASVLVGIVALAIAAASPAVHATNDPTTGVTDECDIVAPHKWRLPLRPQRASDAAYTAICHDGNDYYSDIEHCTRNSRRRYTCKAQWSDYRYDNDGTVVVRAVGKPIQRLVLRLRYTYIDNHCTATGDTDCTKSRSTKTVLRWCKYDRLIDEWGFDGYALTC